MFSLQMTDSEQQTVVYEFVVLEELAIVFQLNYQLRVLGVGQLYFELVF